MVKIRHKVSNGVKMLSYKDCHFFLRGFIDKNCLCNRYITSNTVHRLQSNGFHVCQSSWQDPFSCSSQNHCTTQYTQPILRKPCCTGHHRFSKNVKNTTKTQSCLVFSLSHQQKIFKFYQSYLQDQVFRTESSLPWPLAETSPPKGPKGPKSRRLWS